jgi:hypothetical protein
MKQHPKRRPWPEIRREEMEQYPEVYAGLAAHFASIRAGGPPHIDRPFITVETPDDMPTFESEDEEREFWDVHDMGDAWYENVEPIPDDELPPVRRRDHRSVPARRTS